MRHPRIFEIFLLVSLAWTGCDGDSERDVQEELFDMSLLEQDEEGQWYAPLDEDAPTDLTTSSEPSAYVYSMHNHFVGVSGTTAYWTVHRTGAHGTLCGPESDFRSHCMDIRAYVGAGSWYLSVNPADYCAGGVKNATCLTW